MIWLHSSSLLFAVYRTLAELTGLADKVESSVDGVSLASLVVPTPFNMYA